MLTRLITEDVELHGRTMQAGDTALLLVGSANRDAAVFDDPDRYDLARDASGLVSFGVGRHFCLGASLARLEARRLTQDRLGQPEQVLRGIGPERERTPDPRDIDRQCNVRHGGRV
jgi:cytochrome P450